MGRWVGGGRGRGCVGGWVERERERVCRWVGGWRERECRWVGG